MHNLMEYVCDELKEIERKAEKENKLSAAEVEYADKLLNMKKNLLKTEEMYEGNSFEMEGSYARRGNSYARGNRGGRRGANQYGSYADGYSRAAEDMIEDLRELMHDAPDERTKQEFQRFIKRMEQM